MALKEDILRVMHESREIGILGRTVDGRISFVYSDRWLGADDIWPVSQSIPLRSGNHEHAPVERFFGNLLPEGRLRYMVCRRLGISEDNDFELLKAVGGECAGALRIVPDEMEADGNREDGYREITDEVLAKLVRSGLIYPVFAHDGSIRLSLAGAQDKLPVLCRDNRIFIPSGNAASTHILKFPNRDFKYLPENEVVTTLIAAEMGLPVMKTDLIVKKSMRICRIERYDRVKNDDGELERIHQEDFCQALGFSSQRKYELEGGPSFATCFSLTEKIVDNPLNDTEVLIRWHIFNIHSGNADAHAKNCSILYNGNRSTVLAPFYDLVCTALYPKLDTRMAMSVGGCFDSGQLTVDCWKKMADEIGIGYSFLKNTTLSMAETIPDKTQTACNSFREQYGAHPVIERIQSVIAKRSRRLRYLLK